MDGNIIYFNEAEDFESLAEYEEDEATKSRGRKAKGKRAADIQGLLVIPVEHRMAEEEMNSFRKETLTAIILFMQDQISQLNTSIECLVEKTVAG